MARLIDQLWFQRKRGRSRGVRMRSNGRSAMTRQSKWTWTPPSVGVSVQTPLPVRSPTTLDLEAVGAVDADDRRGGLQVVRELALELLARGAAHLRRAVALHGDVHGAPPLRIGARVGERVEHRLLRGGDIPLVDEDVFAGQDLRCFYGHPQIRISLAGPRASMLEGWATLRLPLGSGVTG